MSVRHSTQNLGWYLETSEGTSRLGDVSATAYHVFGPTVLTPGFMPTYEKQFIPYYTSGIEPVELVLVDKKVSQSLAFVMTNGMMPYNLYGDAASTGSNPDKTHELAFHKFPKTFTLRWESGYTGNFLKREITACKIQSVVLNMDFTSDYNPITMGINVEGRTYGVASDNTNQADPVHPVTTTTTPDAAFYKDLDTSNQVFTWDGDDWINTILKFSLTSARLHKWTKYSSSTTSDKLHSGKVSHVVEFVIHRNADTNYITDVEADSQKDMVIKLYSSAAGDNNYFFNYALTKVAISQAKPNVAIIENNEIPVYECVGTVNTVVPTFKDGLTDAAPTNWYTDQ